MNRLAGIVVAAVGLIVVVLGVLKVVPGMTGSGVALIVLGAVIFGLSFVPKPDPEGAQRMSTGETLINIFVSPAETFQNLRRHPRWLAAALIIAVLSAIFTNLFFYRLTPERVTNFIVDKTLQMPIMNDDARRQVEAGRKDAIDQAKDPILRTTQASTAFAMNVFKYCVYALIFFLFALVMGGKLNFWQGFSVAVYAALPPAVIWAVLSSIILFLKDPADIHPLLGQGNLVQDNLGFLFNPAERPVLYTLISMFGLLWFYWLWLLATGLKNAGERVSGSIAWTTVLVLYGALVFLAVISSFIFPGFIS
ncbi:MAG TPA: YIP1 family protein [Pyrinomonadaceae bacterium]|nr:YIP1 family protein [Pyrinomonadaceae bacterium]